MLFPYNSSEKDRFKSGKRALELLGIDHSISVENVILGLDETKGLLANLGFSLDFDGEIQIDYNIRNTMPLIL